ncbi:bifunctional diguanylate cyclase/phosphodiesterase [Alteromonas pelagimontana]|uniref:Bifunctional diguanylate cyclase/phosphodiesterase n=1 Tax=Alteromonas pelagimontana TaxID=1858656 RepID=A0A6M4MH57_9ALTE|nr:bifunctional diguanylate cyclase/phosphodiesterase [Alteromonas pelagimontana]QJR82317.1 bifunctional diguanylate cyclase/phosphodiesterase [Alteromonas pelagimontana]
MPDSLELIKNDNKLRKRLLLGSISLSLLVIAIFCYVGYGLMLEMEEDLEVQAFKDQFSDIEELILPQLSADNLPNKQVTLTGRDVAILTKDVVFVSVNDVTLLQPEKQFDVDNVLAALSDTGFFTFGDQNYFAHRAKLAGTDDTLFVVWEAIGLVQVSQQIISRLSVAAFLTFWLAVWSALIMSAFITRRFEKASKALERLALTDNLTQLYNRNALFALQEEDENKGALFLLDLDRFRDINDALGHDMGDRLLKAYAKRLTHLAGKEMQVFRYRSDEFVLWLPHVKREEVQDRAFKILYDCREPLRVGSSAFEIGCSIGVVLMPEHGRMIETLIKNAENAMHRAKRLRLGVQIYNDRLAYNSTIKVTLRSQLRSALHQQQFELYYQPKVVMSTGSVVGVEAVVRWNHPEEGLLPPGYFIDLVEQSGIVHAFTRYTLESAVSQIKIWEDEGRAIPVSVNLSAYNLIDGAFVPFVEQLLAHFAITPSLLEFELTESATMVDIGVSKKMIKSFRSLGIKTSIDDFGTGMSSFAYLRDLDIDTVKLDKSFIQELRPDSKDEKIVEGIVSLCRSLGIGIVAEGVETLEQAETLQRLNCLIAQGFFYGRPVPVTGIDALMSASQKTVVHSGQ